jgi:Ser/Thr protein kinase RdoA (MazF antagonist)
MNEKDPAQPRRSDAPLDPAATRFFGLEPAMVLDAVEAAGLAPTGQFQQLNSLENRVFSVQVEPESLARRLEESFGAAAAATASESAPDRVVVKIYRPGRWNAAQIAREHGFLAELAAGGVPVASPLYLGRATALAGAPASLGLSQGMFHAIWPARLGRIPDEFNPPLLEAFGRHLARLHQIGSRGQAPERARISADGLIREPLSWLEASGLVPAQVARRYRAAAELAADALDRSLAGLPVHRIHGDCHWGNLLARGGKLCFLDFDDMAVGPAVQDLWMIAAATDEEGLRQRDIVLEAYRALRPFPEEWLEAVNPLKAGRYVHYAAWIARRWADPAFRAAFGHFGELEYWETETRDLEQLVRRGIEPRDAGGKPALPAEDWSHLTNKDYFWDMED